MVDVSKNTVAVLLVLVIVVSGFSTWSLLNKAAASNRPVQEEQPVRSTDAAVGLNIRHSPNQGYVVLNVESSHG